MNINSELINAIKTKEYLASMASAKPNTNATSDNKAETIYVGCTAVNVSSSEDIHYHPIAVDAAFLGEDHENKLLFSNDILEIQAMLEPIRMMQDNDVVILDFTQDDFIKLNKNYSITIDKINNTINSAVNALAPIDKLIDRSVLTSAILIGIDEKTDGIIGTGFTSERKEIDGDDFDYDIPNKYSIFKAAAIMTDEEKEEFLKKIDLTESYIEPSAFEIALYNYLNE